MVRPRDRKGRFISEEKIPVGIFRPKHVPHINTSDLYTGITSRWGNVGSEWRSKEPSSPPIVEQKLKRHMSVDPILNQGGDPECIQQFLNNQKERVLEPAKDIPTEDISEELGDNFLPNQVDEPSESNWDTTPAASTIKFFRGMVVKE